MAVKLAAFPVLSLQVATRLLIKLSCRLLGFGYQTDVACLPEYSVYSAELH